MATADPTAKPAARVASGRDYALLLSLSAMWGGSFPLIKVAVGSLPPRWVAGGRIGLGALALMCFMAVRGTRLPRGRAVWARLGYMGVAGNIAPFALISWGEQRMPSGIAAILMAMVPMMVVVVAHFRLPDEPLTFGKSIGVVLGIVGTLVLIGPSALTGLGGNRMNPVRTRTCDSFAAGSANTKYSRALNKQSTFLEYSMVLAISVTSWTLLRQFSKAGTRVRAIPRQTIMNHAGEPVGSRERGEWLSDECRATT